MTDIAEPSVMTLPAISRGRDRHWRPCRLEAASLEQVTDRLEQYRQFREARLGRLDEHPRETGQGQDHD